MWGLLITVLLWLFLPGHPLALFIVCGVGFGIIYGVLAQVVQYGMTHASAAGASASAHHDGKDAVSTCFELLCAADMAGRARLILESLGSRDELDDRVKPVVELRSSPDRADVAGALGSASISDISGKQAAVGRDGLVDSRQSPGRIATPGPSSATVVVGAGATPAATPALVSSSLSSTGQLPRQASAAADAGSDGRSSGVPALTAGSLGSVGVGSSQSGTTSVAPALTAGSLTQASTQPGATASHAAPSGSSAGSAASVGARPGTVATPANSPVNIGDLVADTPIMRPRRAAADDQAWLRDGPKTPSAEWGGPSSDEQTQILTSLPKLSDETGRMPRQSGSASAKSSPSGWLSTRSAVVVGSSATSGVKDDDAKTGSLPRVRR